MIETREKKYKEDIIENFDFIGGIKKFGIALGNLFVNLFKFLKFIMVTLPRFIIKTAKAIWTFAMYVRKVMFGFVISLILLSITLTLCVMYIFGYEAIDSLLPGIIFAIILVIAITYQEAEAKKKNKENPNVISLAQRYALKTLIFSVTNPFINIFWNLDPKVDGKNPQKNFAKILTWVFYNLPQILVALAVQAYIVKIISEKIFKYILFYMNNR